MVIVSRYVCHRRSVTSFQPTETRGTSFGGMFVPFVTITVIRKIVETPGLLVPLFGIVGLVYGGISGVGGLIKANKRW